MSGPRFLSLQRVLRLHEIALAEFGGSEGVRDRGLIESAVASAKNTFYYANGDLFDIAAAYAFHLAESQGFIDGNKRTAAMAALVFPKLNGHNLHPDQQTFYEAMIAIAEKRLDKTGLAALFRQMAQP